MIDLVIIPAFLIAFAVGSNDSSNALSISIGAGVIKFKKAVYLFGILVFAGIFFNGNRVMETVGKSLVKTEAKSLTIGLFIAAILIILSNWKRLPLSTHQVIIGSLLGGAVATKTQINLSSLSAIFVSWIISPLVATFVSFFLYKLAEKIFLQISFFKIETLLRYFLLISASLISYNTGANELATVLGPVIYSGISINHLYVFLVSSFLVFLGAFLLSHRVIETVGKSIISLDPFSGFIAQAGAGLCIFIFTLFGMPVSTTYCMIGAISGVGMTKGLNTIKLNLLKKILLNWVLTFFTAFILCFISTKLIILRSF